MSILMPNLTLVSLLQQVFQKNHYLYNVLSYTDAEKIKENQTDENESQNYVNGTMTTPKQFEAIKQQKEIWEQGIVM